MGYTYIQTTLAMNCLFLACPVNKLSRLLYIAGIDFVDYITLDILSHLLTQPLS